MENTQSNFNRVHPEVGGPRIAAQRPEASRRFAALAKTRINEHYFYEKECDEYCKTEKDPNLCQCGLPVDEHLPEVQEKKHGIKWDSKTSTRRTKWRCFGNVRFKNQDTMTSNSPYIRINDDVDVPQLVEQLHMRWKLSKPSLIISVTGGASDFAMKKKDHDRLRQGLQRVAATKGAWVITGGTNAGIMKICGEAVRDQLLTSTSSPSSNSGLVNFVFCPFFDNLELPRVREIYYNGCLKTKKNKHRINVMSLVTRFCYHVMWVVDLF